MGNTIDVAAKAAQILNYNALKLGARVIPAESNSPRPAVDSTADKVAIKDNLFRAANLNLAVEGDQNEQPEQRSSTTNLEYQRREATVLRLRTQEGDVVKLKLRNVETTTAEVGQQVDGETVVSNLSLSSTSRSRLLISVRGDINDAELAAIQGVADQAAQLAGSFFNGNLNQAFQAASDFAIDASQLAKVSLKLSVRERLSFAQTVVGNTLGQALPPATDGGEEVTSPAPQTGTVAPKPVSNTPSTTVNRTDVPPPAVPVNVSSPATQSDAVAPEVDPADEATPASPSNLLDAFQALADFLNSIASFIEDLLGRFEPQPQDQGDDTGSTTSDDTTASAFSFRFKLDLFAAIVTQTIEQADANVEEPSGGTQLFTDTLAAVSQQVDPQSVSETA